MASFCAEPERYAQFVAYREHSLPLGMAEASVRTDYVNGTQSSPVAYLEGIYVVPDARRQGVARCMLAAVEQWAKSRGCCELASDAAIENQLGLDAHRGLGFWETERVVFFKKLLTRPS